MVQEDHVARIQRQTRGRQAEHGAFAAYPCLHQRATAAALGFFWRNCHREGLGRDAGGIHRDAPCLDLRGVVILVSAGDLPFQGLRQFGFLRPG